MYSGEPLNSWNIIRDSLLYKKGIWCINKEYAVAYQKEFSVQDVK